MWLVYPSASASDSTIWFSLDHKRRRHKGSRMKMETFWFFRFWFRRASAPPITTPSVVKTSLNITQARSSGYLWDIKHVLPNIEWKNQDIQSLPSAIIEKCNFIERETNNTSRCYLWWIEEWRMQKHVKFRYSWPWDALTAHDHLSVSTRKIWTEQSWNNVATFD